MIQVRKLRKKYPTAGNVLKGLNFDLDPNLSYALMGHSGSGKSTLLKILAGYEVADMGTLQYAEGKVDLTFTGLVAGRIGVAFVSQEDRLLPKHTVLEQLDYTTRNLTSNESKRRIEQLAEVLSIKHLYKRKVHELSGGEKQRVNLASQLLVRAPLLLLDEPFTFLDTAARMAVFSLVKEYCCQDKTTFVFATHLADEVFTLADQVIVLKEGKYVRQTDPRTLYIKPHDPYEGNLLGQCYSLKIGIQEERLVRPEWWAEQPGTGVALDIFVDTQHWSPQGFCISGFTPDGQLVTLLSQKSEEPGSWIKRYINFDSQLY